MSETLHEITKKRVKQLRTTQQMTQEEFSAELEVAVDTIRKIEQGQKLTEVMAIKICHRFGVSLDYLYGVTESSDNNAARIVNDLRKYFKIRFEDCKNYKDEPSRFMFATIDENLYSLLMELDNLEKLRKDKSYIFSDSIFDSMETEIFNKYNSLLSFPSMVDNGKEYVISEYKTEIRGANTLYNPNV